MKVNVNIQLWYQQIIEVNLEDTERSAKKFQQTIAELSRPARALKEKERELHHKPQGRKRKNTPRPAKYKNWHTPFCWSQITLAAKRVGWKMSATAIAKELKRMDPVTFASIHFNTIDGWIDQSGNKPQWKESILQRVEEGLGNSPGHNKGGRRGILVCNCIQSNNPRLTVYEFSHHIRI